MIYLLCLFIPSICLIYSFDLFIPTTNLFIPPINLSVYLSINLFIPSINLFIPSIYLFILSSLPGPSFVSTRSFCGFQTPPLCFFYCYSLPLWPRIPPHYSIYFTLTFFSFLHSLTPSPSPNLRTPTHPCTAHTFQHFFSVPWKKSADIVLLKPAGVLFNLHIIILFFLVISLPIFRNLLLN